ncbi:E3 ubiquitin-protein ligase huwe1 [Tyrophagus putrescentiae]|nr:E3 ubiquitin-protein ligase huwe1 [Tyrophagus putrescentiae]
MKIDRVKLKRQYLGTEDAVVPPDIKDLITKLKNAMDADQARTIINEIKTWPYKKSDLYHWVDILDAFDIVLEECAKKVGNNQWQLYVDQDQNKKLLLIDVLEFTTLLVKHCFSSHVYSSFEHLTALMNSTDLTVVITVLELLFALAKRGTQYLPLNQQDKKPLQLRNRINFLAEDWGGKDNGVSFKQCIQDLDSYPSSATTVHLEFYTSAEKSEKKVMHIENVHLLKKPLAQMMNDLVLEYKVPAESQQQLFNRLRLSSKFADLHQRQLCVQARLSALAISALIEGNFHVSPSLIEETAEILTLDDLYNLKSVALKALRSFINYERNTKLRVIIESTGANSYHGLIPKLTRAVINSMIDPSPVKQYPMSFTSSLFNFVYHMGFYESGRQALQQCGIIERFLKFLQHNDDTLDNLNLVARAVRIIESITARDIAILQSHNGLNVIQQRFQREVEICQKVFPQEIAAQPSTESQSASDRANLVEDVAMQTEDVGPSDVSKKLDNLPLPVTTQPANKCHPLRSTVIRGLLSFLRKATQYPSLSETIRPMMQSTEFIQAVKHLISNPDFYGSTVFAYAIDMVSLYVHHEPSLLSTLQENGLAGVMLKSLFDPERKLPVNKDFSNAMSNVLTALCLNSRGLAEFVEAKPFEKILAIFTKPEYMSNLQINGNMTASFDNTAQLGKACDQLIRHQPSLRVPGLNAIVRALEQLTKFGNANQYVIVKESFIRSGHTLSFRPTDVKKNSRDTREPVPLLDYITNIMRFLQSILNTSNQHATEFMRQQGFSALLALLTLPNLPADFGNSAACYYMSTVMWWLFKCTLDKNIFVGVLQKLKSIMTDRLDPVVVARFSDSCKNMGPSVMLNDLIQNAQPKEKWQETELWRAISMMYTHISVLLQVCRPDHSSDQLRNLALEQWATKLGQELINALSRIHVMLHWETVNMTACVEEGALNDHLSEHFPKLKDQFDALVEIIDKAVTVPANLLAAMSESIDSPMDVDQPIDQAASQESASTSATTTQANPATVALMKKLVDPIVATSRNISKSIEDLFALLLKLCVGNSTSAFHRRAGFVNQLGVPTPNARSLAKNLNSLPNTSMRTILDRAVPSNFRFLFYEPFITHSISILFDNRNNPYQLVLQNFVFSGAQDAFFDLFDREVKTVIDCYSLSGIKYVPKGFEHFLDVWLSLAERLSNSERILETPHSIPSKKTDAILATSTYVGFEPMEYIIRTHRQLYAPILTLWNAGELLSTFKTKQIRSSVLLLISELFRASSLIDKYISKRKEVKTPTTASTTAAAQAQPQNPGSFALFAEALGLPSLSTQAATASVVLPTPPSAPVPIISTSAPSTSTPTRQPQNAEHTAMLNMLVEMGFERSAAADAFIHCGYDITAAADWLIMHQNASNPGSLSASTNEIAMSDEDQVARAIAMSLEQDEQPESAEQPAAVSADTATVTAAPASTSAPSATTSAPVPTTSTVAPKAAVPAPKAPKPAPLLENETPLEKEKFDQLLVALLPGLISLLAGEPIEQDLFKCAELLNVIVKAGYTAVYDDVASHVLSKIRSVGDMILSQPVLNTEKEHLKSILSPKPEASGLATCIHFLLLICNESKGSCMKKCTEFSIFTLAVDLIGKAAHVLSLASELEKDVEIPDWLCPITVLLDLYEKFGTGFKLRNELISRPTGRVWKTFQRSVRWSPFDHANNRLIDDAYCAGETSTRISVDANRKYTIRFDTMTQHGEATGSKRPIMYVFKEVKESKKSKAKAAAADSKNADAVKEPSKPTEEIVVPSFVTYTHKDFLRAVVALIKLPKLDSAFLNAIVRIILRITMTNHSAACDFAEQGGIGALLKLSNKVNFPGSSTSTLFIIRHVFEDCSQLENAMEREVRRLATLSSPTPSVNQEMHNILRNFMPLAARNALIFKDVVKRTLKVNISNKSQTNSHEDRSPTYLEVVKEPTGGSTNVELHDTAKDVITELLCILPLRLMDEQKRDSEKKGKKKDDDSPLFNTKTILSFLAELIKSYPSVAKVFCDHVYSRGFCDLITEDLSALSFIIDHMLSVTDATTPTYSRMIFSALISTLPSSPNLSAIHQVIVNELKSALYRAVHNDSSTVYNTSKHSRIETVVTLVLLIIESCPRGVTDQTQPLARARLQFNSNQLSIIRMMVKCGFVNDMAHSIQTLDLSSPKMAKVVEALTRTLEIISETMTYLPKSRNTSSAGTVSNTSTRPSSNTQALELNSQSNSTGETAPQQEGNHQAALIANENQIHAMEEDDDHMMAIAALSPRRQMGRERNSDEEFIRALNRIRRNELAEDMDASVEEPDDDDDDDDDDEELSEAASLLEEINRHNEALENQDEEDDGVGDEEDDDRQINPQFDGVDEVEDEEEEEGDEEDDGEEFEDDDEEDFDAIPMPPPDLLEDFSDLQFTRDFSYNLQPLGRGDPYAAHQLIRLSAPLPDALTPHPMLTPSQNTAQAVPRPATHPDMATARFDELWMQPRQRRNAGFFRIGDGGTYRFSIPRDRSSFANIQDEISNILHRIRGPNVAISPQVINQFTNQISNIIQGNFNQNQDIITPASPFGSLYVTTSLANPSPTNPSYGASPTSNIARWDEECRLVMGEFVFDSLMSVHEELVNHLEKCKLADIEARKEEQEAKLAKQKEALKAEESAAAAALKDARKEEEAALMSLTAPDPQPAPQSGEDNLISVDEPMAEVGSLQIEPEPASSISQVSENSEQLPPSLSASTSENVDQPMSEPTPPHASVESPIVIQTTATTTGSGAQTPTSSANVISESVVMEEEAPPAAAEGSSVASAGNEEEPIAATSSAATASASTATPELTPELQAILGDIQIPEGIDPSYLAALPEDMRQEVISEQLRIQRLARQQAAAAAASAAGSSSQQPSDAFASAAATAASSSATNEISPEFLAALPPDIRQEVLAQQRAEQMGVPNPHAPVDPNSFLQTLPPSLRRQVLADMDDSQVQLLTGELAQEARVLRREHVIRREHAFMEEYMVDLGRGTVRNAAGNNALGINRLAQNIRVGGLLPPLPMILRRGFRTFPTGQNANVATRQPHHHHHHQQIPYGNSVDNLNAAYLTTYATARTPIKGKHLLDHDSLSSLMLLFFVSDASTSIARLHRLVRNVCYHLPTRQWVISSLLEILERAKLSATEQKFYSTSDETFAKYGIQNRQVSWLSLVFESAFSVKMNVFQLDPSKASTRECYSAVVHIHPQAVPFVCRKVLDILIYIAKSFPDDFITVPSRESLAVPANTTTTPESEPAAASTPTSGSSTKKHSLVYHQKSIFDVLMSQESIHGSKRSKGLKHFGSNASLNNTESSDSSSSKGAVIVSESPFSQLLNLLSQPFISKSYTLSDRLIRLLSYAMTNTNSGYNDPTGTQEAAINENVLPPTSAKYLALEKALENENLLQLLVSFLTSSTCTDDGLSDAHSLIIKLSTIFPKCREVFHRKLIEAAQEIGNAVYQDIECLVTELKKTVSSSSKKSEPLDLSMPGTSSDRYSETRALIISSNRNTKKPGKEIHLPAMSTLSLKSSSQYILLRILDIVVELRELTLLEKLEKEKDRLAKAINTAGSAVAAAEVVPEAEPLQELYAASNSRSMAIKQIDMDLAIQITANDVKLSDELSQLEKLWNKLSECLDLLQETSDEKAVLVLEPAVEAFFQVHATEVALNKSTLNANRANQDAEQIDSANDTLDSSSSQSNSVPLEDTDKFLAFAERHRVVINQILLQSNVHLTDGTFGFLIDHAKILDFDVKRRYFREELKRLDQGVLRRGLSLPVNRANVFEDSFRALDRLSAEEWKGLFRISFEGEEGQDAGGLLREWYTIIAREIFNPNYALFTHSPGDGVTYMINQSSYYNSNHLNYFRFVGRLIGKAIYENQLLDCYFTRSFYKHMLGKPVSYTDMEAEDNAFYQGLVFLLEHNLLLFVTGSSKIPLQGFAALGGGNDGLKFKIYRDDRSTDSFNQLDLPAYETYDKLRLMLLKAIHECSEGFGFA